MFLLGVQTKEWGSPGTRLRRGPAGLAPTTGAESYPTPASLYPPLHLSVIFSVAKLVHIEHLLALLRVVRTQVWWTPLHACGLFGLPAPELASLTLCPFLHLLAFFSLVGL